MLGPSLRMLGPNHVLNIQSLPLFRTNVKAFLLRRLAMLAHG